MQECFGHNRAEDLAPFLKILERIKAGASGREEHGITRSGHVTGRTHGLTVP